MVSLALYQPATNAFLVFTLVELLIGALGRAPLRAIGRTFLLRAVQVGGGAIAYEGLIGIHIHGWVKAQSEPISLLHPWPELVGNVADAMHYVGTSFNAQWWLYIGPFVTALACAAALVGMRYAAAHRHALGVSAVVALGLTAAVLPFAAFLAAFGPLLLLAHPPMTPRVLVGMGPLIAGGLLLFDAALRKWGRSPHWATGASAIFGLGFAVIASAYGNAAAAQKAYEEAIAHTLGDDIAAASGIQPLTELVIEGSAGYSPLTTHVVEEFPLIRELVPPYLDAHDPFHPRLFLAAYLPEALNLHQASLTPAPPLSSDERRALCANAPVAVRQAYRLYVHPPTAWVVWGKTSPCEGEG